MYNHHIDDMVDAITESIDNNIDAISNGFINKKVLRKTVRKALQDYWDDKIALVWNTKDVIDVAIKNGRLINEEQAKEVLGSVLDNHDANVGVNWDVLFQNLPQN